MPRYLGKKYELWQPLYDTVQLAAAAGALVYNFFAVPFGGLLVAGTVKGYQYTNLIQAGVLERGKDFTIHGLSLNTKPIAQGGIAPSLADVGVLNGGSINMELGQVSFLRLPTCQLPSGGNDIVLNDTATVNVQKGVSSVNNVYWLKAPIHLAEQESISVEMTIPGTIAAVTDVTLTLWGMEIRPVK